MVDDFLFLRLISGAALVRHKNAFTPTALFICATFSIHHHKFTSLNSFRLTVEELLLAVLVIWHYALFTHNREQVDRWLDKIKETARSLSMNGQFPLLWEEARVREMVRRLDKVAQIKWGLHRLLVKGIIKDYRWFASLDVWPLFDLLLQGKIKPNINRNLIPIFYNRLSDTRYSFYRGALQPKRFSQKKT